MSQIDHITVCFQQYCGRLPDPVALRIYADHLAAGVSLEALEHAIANSDEAHRIAIWRQITGRKGPRTEDDHRLLSSIVLPAIAPPVSPPVASAGETRPSAALPDLTDTEAFITSVYLAALGRRPDQTGLEAYAQAIRHGLAPVGVVHDILSSSESLGLNGPSRALDRANRLNAWGTRWPAIRKHAEAWSQAILADALLRLWERRLQPRSEAVEPTGPGTA